MEFNEVVKAIEDSEKNVDKVLKAARLERYPRRNDRLEMIFAYSTAILLVLGVFGIFFMAFYFSAR